MARKRAKVERKTGETVDLISLFKNPVKFLERVDAKMLETIKDDLKDCYDSLKNVETKPSTSAATNLLSSSTLPELVIENFDDEQIWQQIDLQNAEKLRHLKKRCEKIEIDSLKAIFLRENDKNNDKNESENDDDIDAAFGNEKEEENEFEDENSASELNDSENDQKISDAEDANEKNNLEDNFLSLKEMDAYLDAEDKKEMEKESGKSFDDDNDELEVDYFASDNEEDEDEPQLDGRTCRYKDFFDPPKSNSKKQVRFGGMEEKISNDDEIDEEEPKDDDDDDDELPKSSFEERQRKLRQKIKEMENENLSEKPWQMIGEISAKRRPENSLLEEHVLFEHTTKLPPVITQESTKTLEDVIKQRIKDKAWDDVERKTKPVAEHYKYKNNLILDQEKSKMSLSQIYEKEFLKQTQKETEETKNPQHEEIRKLMKNLFVKLDALTNYHYSPKIVVPEVKIVNNMKSIVMEEVAPVTLSEGDLLAPEEIKAKVRGDVKSKEERTKTDKKREHRRKKEITKIKAKRKEAKDKRSSSTKAKVPKDKLKMLEKVGKVQKATVDKSVAGGKRSGGSSQQFFAQLQQQQTTVTAPPKKRMKSDSSKAFKL